jgi:hypothetical protein
MGDRKDVGSALTIKLVKDQVGKASGLLPTIHIAKEGASVGSLRDAPNSLGHGAFDSVG